jgi:hypothetical protein
MRSDCDLCRGSKVERGHSSSRELWGTRILQLLHQFRNNLRSGRFGNLIDLLKNYVGVTGLLRNRRSAHD